MGPRHLAPALFLIPLLLLLPASFVSAMALAFLIEILFAYILAGFYFSLRAKTEGNWDVTLVQPFATFCFHVAYGLGRFSVYAIYSGSRPLCPYGRASQFSNERGKSNARPSSSVYRYDYDFFHYARKERRRIYSCVPAITCGPELPGQ